MKMFAFRAAMKQALRSKYPKYAHGAVIERGGRIISVGYNTAKVTAPKQNSYSTHAECACINHARLENIEGANLYVVRITNNKLAMSRPCPRCQLAIKASGIKKVYYSSGDQKDEYGEYTV